MKWVYRILRSVFVIAIVLAVLVPSGLFVALSIPGVQHSIRAGAERELTKLLGMNVAIGDVNVAPFSRVTLRRVAITDAAGDTAIAANRIGAGLNLGALILKRRLVVNFTELIGLDVRLSRDSISAPLNIQPMIDALSPKEPGKPPTRFDFRVNTVVVRTLSLRYDILSEPRREEGFDPNHIFVDDFRADLRLPRMANDDFRVVLRRLAFAESSGFRLTGLEGDFNVGSTKATAENVVLRLPDSQISLRPTEFDYDSLKAIGRFMENPRLLTGIETGSYVNLADIAPFLPAFSAADLRANLSMALKVADRQARLEELDITVDNGATWLRADAVADGFYGKLDEAHIDLRRISLGASGDDISQIILKIAGKPLDGNLEKMLANLGHIDLLGEADGNRRGATTALNVLTDVGQIVIAADAQRRREGEYVVKVECSLPDVDGTKLTAGLPAAISKLESLTADLRAEFTLVPHHPVGYSTLNIARVVYGATELSDVVATVNIDGNYAGLSAESRNPACDFNLDAETSLADGWRSLKTTADVNSFHPSIFNPSLFPGRNLSANLDMDARWGGEDNIAGRLTLNNIRLDGSEKPLDIKNVTLESTIDSLSRSITLTSDLADASITGNFTPKQIVAACRRMASDVLPSLVAAPAHPVNPDDNGHADVLFTLKTTDPLGDAINLPLSVIYPVDGTGEFDFTNRHMALTVDAPYLQQKGKLLENTILGVKADADTLGGRAAIDIATQYLTKKGEMTLKLNTYAAADHVDTKLSWNVARERGFFGDINLSTAFSRDADNDALNTLVRINPSELVMNDTVWTIDPATIDISGKLITVNNLRIGREGQYVAINGVVGAEENDSITVALRDVNLDYVFETLDIQTAMFGGIATGNFYAIAALSKTPRLYTDGLNVDRLSYNHSLMGDTHILSEWDNDRRAVNLHAVIDQPNGRQSKIEGSIMPMSDSLDFQFDADKIEIGFMLPFMEAFTSSVSGYASGKARLWGSFKYIDMVGDIYAEDVKLKLDFTNTSYIATDSVHLTPGYIDLNNIHLRDVAGHTAILNGWLRHEYFKKPKFRFNITDARDMLVYDVAENSETNWYGRIYGNGGATITGEPGIVDISVNMQTAPNSTFTFVLSDAEHAYDYTFITFRDRDQARKDSLAAATAPPAAVRELKERIAKGDDGGEPSIYKMNIAVDVTPNAQVTLVMDPVGGDRIRAYGNGNLRMTYDSANEDLRMFGTYTLTRGNYNFTLQDIIIKDFTIRDGSSITFTGDPFAAQLDIEAVYSLNANLSDLDESFLQDKELNRTNVPVHALLLVNGDMRQPDISFDLEFPTLTQDTYRKVRSIVSTEDMMNRQIIYLLALNRFYTPDYMTTTKGNELVSVASSTLSSQLGSILGQLSDNWSIAPTVRSDRGDFSDVEVDLALSSHLLNNRLMLNGNFGYRDKSLNSNTFIGDFDIEYLLNRRGTIRLKAYNRYNDRNYYLRSALTTQGVGVVFKRDFDNIFSFLRNKEKSTPALVAPADTLAPDTLSPDTLSPDTLSPDTLSIPTDTVVSPSFAAPQIRKGRFPSRPID